MDLSTNQEGIRIERRFGSSLFEANETFNETEIKGNNNLFNSLKTEANCNLGHDPSSLVQVRSAKDKNLEVDNSLFSYSSFKKAMDLRIHNRTVDGIKRTIFDDAEYFAKNYCYKLLPITFEQVDETIIQSEHNYTLSSLNSESEPDEDCSRTMDYAQIKEKNYKRRRAKCEERNDEEDTDHVFDCEMPRAKSCDQNSSFKSDPNHQNISRSLDSENTIGVQPLDLSASPLVQVQEDKTDPYLRELPNSNSEKNSCEVDDKGNMNGILVTITRPNEKENYQPCDLFLNDIARLVPWLIDKDCFEIDILDRTCDRPDEFRNHRLYYVISEATWRLFQKTNERIILTNDPSLGQPFRKVENKDKPSYMVFDQYSLAKCLAEYCQEMGGCFEYTCVEEDESCVKEEKVKKPEDEIVKEKETIKVEKLSLETQKNYTKAIEIDSKLIEKPVKTLKKGFRETTTETKAEETSERKLEEDKLKATQNISEECVPNKADETSVVEKASEVSKDFDPTPKYKKENSKRKITKSRKQTQKAPPRQVSRNENTPKNPRTTTGPKPTPKQKTSRTSNKSVNKRGKRKTEAQSLPKAAAEEPPNKRRKSEDICRRTRSGKVLEEAKTDKPIDRQGSGKRVQRGKIATKEMKKVEQVGRTLRSQTNTGKQADKKMRQKRT